MWPNFDWRLSALFPIVCGLIAIGCHKNSSTTDAILQPVQRSWPVMGTLFSLSIWPKSNHSENNHTGLNAALAAAWEKVQSVDRHMSHYRADSDISRLNRQAGAARPLAVSLPTFSVLKTAQKICRESAGAFDITVGPLVQLWGFQNPYHGEQIRPPSAEQIKHRHMLTGCEQVLELTPPNFARLKVKGAAVDLGGIAKGYALDLAAEALRENGVGRAQLDLGGQLLFIGEPPLQPLWQVQIRPTELTKNTAYQTLAVRAGSVAVSSGKERFFEYAGKTYAHILDPRTGWPVEHRRGVATWAPSAIAADAWSTALFVLGPSTPKQILDMPPELQIYWF